MLMRPALLTLLAMSAIAARPKSNGDERPIIRVGENVEYAVHSSRFGNIGTATMRVELDTLDGNSVYRLSFDFSARIALFKVSDHTRSWLDTETLCTLRYAKQEKSPLGGRQEDVRVDGDVAPQQPLDELSFIYFIRALDLEPGDTLVVRRHFDQKRNPVRITALSPNYYEMTVPDPRQKSGLSRLRFLISDDEARVPLRIESSMPMAGTITMTLTTR